MSAILRPSRALVAYSVLAERLKNSGATYFQALMPFLAMACKGYAGQLFDASKFSDSINDLFGIRIPRLMALGLADQLCAEGYLEKIFNGRAVVFKYSNYVDELDDSEISPVTEAQVNEIITQFITYVSANGRGISLDGAYLEEAFFNRLLNIESMKILSRKDYKVGLKAEKTTIVLDGAKGAEMENRDEIHLDFLVSDFLVGLYENNSESFEVVSNVAFANMAAEALACFGEPPEKYESLREVVVYLDTPLILDILGVNAEYADYGAELAGLLRDCGAKIAVMDHCVVEAENAIAAQHDSMMTGIGKQTALLSGSIKPEVLAALRGRVSDRVRSYGIEHLADPEINLHKRNERATGTLQTNIQNRMVAWGNEEAKRHDEKSVLSVIALRNVTVPARKISECGVFFLTRNSALVNIANSAWIAWLKDTTNHAELTRSQWAPLALSDKQFAGFIWMMKGGASSIPRSRLLAHCASAMRPRSDVKTRAYNLILEAHGKQDADHFAALMSERDSGRALMRASMGDPLDVTQDRVPYIIDVVKREAGEYAAAQERAKAEEEKASLIEESSKAIEKVVKESELRALEEKARYIQVDIDRQREEARANELQRQLDDAAAREKARQRSITLLGLMAGCREYRSTKILLVLIFGLAAALVADIGAFPTIARLGTTGLAMCSFWYVPSFLEAPAHWIAMRRTRNVMKMKDPYLTLTAGTPDFEKKIWGDIHV